MSTALRFREAVGPQPGGAVRLRFGYIGEPPVIPPPAGLRAWVSAPWRPAAPLAARVAAPWRAAGRLGPSWLAAPWVSLGAVAPARFRAPWSDAGRLEPTRANSPWRDTLLTRSAWAAPWHSGIPLKASVAASWHQALLGAGWIRAPWGAGQALHRRTRAPWQSGVPSTMRLVAPFGLSHLAAHRLRAPWNDGIRLTSYGGPWVAPVVLVVPVVPCYQPQAGGAVALIFRDEILSLTRLIFSCNHGTITIRVPVRRVYMVTNVTSLVRVDGGASIPCYGMSLSLDEGSWAWGFSATLPATALSLIEPSTLGVPVELEATINGTAFRLVPEAIGRERVFGTAGLRVSGRGKTAVLDAPFSPVVTFSASSARTTQQLIEAAMPSGWAVDWGITAWSVPGGVWSHQGTPATAAVAIALAGGGYVQPHASQSRIAVLPRYPSAPWAWASVTPDIELPSAVTTREAIEWVDRPRYNGVYVSGTTAGGVLRLVKITGTAADLLAPMVTDPLTTHSDAAAQRGLSVLSNTGRKALVTLRLPVLPETGVIRPGAFVRYGARVGLVRSVSVDAAWPEVWQTIGVETYVG